METFRTTITPVLTVRHAAQAVAFYREAFSAQEICRNTYPDGRIVAGNGRRRRTVQGGR